MNKLEEIVPPFELCKLIPKGEFEDSCFAWYAELQHINPKPPHEYSYYVANSNKDFLSFGGFNACPAPTLQEIMVELPASNIYRIKQTWTANFINDSIDNGIKSKKPATAALKLWLELKGIEYEK